MLEILTDYTLRTVVMGTLFIGIVSGILGCFAVLRKQSLLGDAISHASLPGIALAFLFTLSKNPIILLMGAMIAGWVGTILIMIITKKTHIKEDTALGIVLSVFFGFGIFLLTIIQKLPTANKAGLDKFLFGNASTLLQGDVIVIGIGGIIALIVTFLLWKEFKLIAFDKEYAKSIGYNVNLLDILMISLIVISIVIGLQAVGVVLMSALLIAPAVAARQWTNRLGVMSLLAAIFGGISGVAGALISSSYSKIPTGPSIVVVVSIIVMISLFFSPKRGLIRDWIKNAVDKKKVKIKSVLVNLYMLGKEHRDPYFPHSIESLKALDKTKVEKSLMQLEELKLVKSISKNRYHLTDEGIREAERLAG